MELISALLLNCESTFVFLVSFFDLNFSPKRMSMPVISLNGVSSAQTL